MIFSLALLGALTVQHLPVMVIRAPRAALTLQIARTEAQREFGLMNVAKLDPHTGMIFVFDNDGPEEFWMKDTLIPLDMVFLAADGTVRKVFVNVPAVPVTTPDDRIPRRAANAKYVLELPAFEAERDGIVPGIKLPDVTTAH